MIPPMCVCSAAVEQDDRCQGICAVCVVGLPMQTMEPDAILGMEVE